MTTTRTQAFRRPGDQIQLAILTLLTSISTAQAQTTPSTTVNAELVPEVVVTATKRSTSLQRTPIAITSLDNVYSPRAEDATALMFGQDQRLQRHGPLAVTI